MTRSAPGRRRLDLELVRRGMAESAEHAQEQIRRHSVLVAGCVAENASRLVSPSEPIVTAPEPPRFVSRGGTKLDAALDRFGLAPTDLRVLDVGASTGGFTDCLLQRGAASVVALDAGHGQLHHSLRTDPRVVVVERTDVRRSDPAALGAPFPMVVADLSFTSLLEAAEALLGLARRSADLVLLVKPQYEVQRREALRAGGVVEGAVRWAECLHRVLGGYSERGASVRGLMASPLRGAHGKPSRIPHGNVEFLAWLQVPPGRLPSLDLDRAVREVVAEVERGIRPVDSLPEVG